MTRRTLFYLINSFHIIFAYFLLTVLTKVRFYVKLILIYKAMRKRSNRDKSTESLWLVEKGGVRRRNTFPSDFVRKGAFKRLCRYNPISPTKCAAIAKYG